MPQHRKKQVDFWHRASVLAAVAGAIASIGSSVTAVGTVAILGRFLTAELLFGFIAPTAAVAAGALALYLQRGQSQDSHDESEK